MYHNYYTYYGGPGVGKTQFCYTSCVMLPSPYKVIYIDTENSFRPERIQEIAKGRGLDSEQILQRIHFTKALNSKQQEGCIKAARCEINSDNKIKLVIVDSIISHYNAEYAGRGKTLPEKMQRLNESLHILLKAASSEGVAVVVTNHQTQSSLDSNAVVPSGRNVTSYASRYRIHLAGQNNDRRRARLEYSPSHPQSDTYFVIDEKRGFTDIEEEKW
jgi:DNA repair protein RadA